MRQSQAGKTFSSLRLDRMENKQSNGSICGLINKQFIFAVLLLCFCVTIQSYVGSVISISDSIRKMLSRNRRRRRDDQKAMTWLFLPVEDIKSNGKLHRPFKRSLSDFHWTNCWLIITVVCNQKQKGCHFNSITIHLSMLYLNEVVKSDFCGLIIRKFSTAFQKLHWKSSV